MTIQILLNLQDPEAGHEIDHQQDVKKSHQGNTRTDTTIDIVMVKETIDIEMKATAIRRKTEEMSGLDQQRIDIKEITTKINTADMKNSLWATIEEIVEVIVVVTVAVTVVVTVVIAVVIVEIVVIVVIGVLIGVLIEVLIVVAIVVVIVVAMTTAIEEMVELVIYKDIRVKEFKFKEKDLAIMIVTALEVVTIAQATATETIESPVDLKESIVDLMNLITNPTIREKQSHKVMGKEWQGCLVQREEQCSQIGMETRSPKDKVSRMQRQITENRINS